MLAIILSLMLTAIGVVGLTIVLAYMLKILFIILKNDID